VGAGVEGMEEKMQTLLANAEYAEKLPPEGKERVEKLRALNTQHEEIELEYEERRKELELEFNRRYQPLYDQRAKVIAGEEAARAGMDEFWLVAMTNSEVVSEIIQDKDRPALKSLRDIKCILSEDDAMSFTLEFHFGPNEYFKNDVLQKTYSLIDDDEPILERAEGTVIDWKPGKNLTVKTLKKKVPNKKGGKPITKTKQEPCDSFFNFFSPPDLDELEDLDEEQEEQIHEFIQADFEVGAAFRERLVPHAVLWFTGEAMDEQLEYEDEDEEESEEEEVEEVAPRSRGKGGGKGGRTKPVGGAQEGDQECKQQ
jgi:nucleosome assembly protein 1-like 1